MIIDRSGMALVAGAWIVGLLLVTSPITAEAATPVYVGANGADEDACTTDFPCRTLAGALAKVSPGGDVIVQDSGDYGPATITQSVSIVAVAGASAIVAVPTGNGITVNGAGTKVRLRGLTIKGTGGNYGIYFQSGSVLHVENCEISEMAGRSINMEANGSLFVTDTVVRDGGSIGITAPGTARATLTRVQARNGSGMVLEGGTIVVRDSIVTNTTGRAIIVEPNAGALLHVTLDRVTSSGNVSRGLSAIGGISRVVVRDSTLADNTDDGVEVSDGATVILTRNVITGNGGNGIYNAGSTVITTGDNVISNNAAGDVAGSLTPLPPI